MVAVLVTEVAVGVTVTALDTVTKAEEALEDMITTTIEETLEVCTLQLVGEKKHRSSCICFIFTLIAE